ncbi:MAG TPA: AIR carboxylase family protein, partial [Opitutaceae bacterium]|nr:AIR carboxylase family protein [Opitutaceae bacterium]
MGSTSDWETMQHTAQTLDTLGIPYEKRVISAHRTPQLMYEWGTTARTRGLKIVIAGAGGAAHLAGVAAALTPLP